MKTLEKATTQVDSRQPREALRTAHSLVSAAREKKSRDMSWDLENLDKAVRVLNGVPFSVYQEELLQTLLTE
ncbi:hypothetical protein ONS96_011818 [Cadophora gregata f. sp. sojae]|nr:hypothetical protein ONS96_011818 [Cadophora gregata f. sp. sojae]